MHIGEIFPRKYLKASDIGSSKQFTIKGVTIEEVGQDRERKPVLHFTGEQKALVLNKTNGSMIAAILHSDDTTSWAGKAINLITEPVSFQGRTNPGIRVRATSTPKHGDVDDKLTATRRRMTVGVEHNKPGIYEQPPAERADSDVEIPF